MKVWRLYLVLAISGIFFVSELVASQVVQSLILLMDSYHMLYNCLSLLLIAVSYSASEKKTSKNTFGWARLEIVGVLVNLLFFAALCFAIVIEGIQGLVEGQRREGKLRCSFLVLIFGLVRLLLNATVLVLIKGFTQHQNPLLRMKNEYTNGNEQNGDPKTNDSKQKSNCNSRLLMDSLRDNSGCVLVIFCGLLEYYLDEPVPVYVEFIFSMLVVAILVLTSYPFVYECSLILLQTIPHHLNMETLKCRLIKEFPVILNIHDIHIWQLNSSQTIATVHVVLASVSAYVRIANQLANFFRKEGISQVTIQPEFSEEYNSRRKMECILKCSPIYNCGTLTCCGHLLISKTHSKKSTSEPAPQIFTINSVDELCKDSYDLPKMDICDLQSAVF